MLNWIWMGLIVVAVIVGALMGTLDGENGFVEKAFESAEVAVINLALPLSAIMIMWLGIMRLGEKAGLIGVISKLIRPVMSRLFPDVPGDHPAMSAMIMNMAANMLGLGNAATPLGLKAMQDLQKINPLGKGTASNAMCTFLAINTSSVTLIPATAIGYLAAAGVESPTRIVATAIGATLCSTIVAVIAVKLLQRMPVFAAERSMIVEDEEIDEVPSESEEKLSPWTTGRKVAVGLLLASFIFVAALQLFPPFRDAVQSATGIDTYLAEKAAAAEAAAAVERTVQATSDIPVWNSPLGLMNNFSIVAIPLIFLVFVGYAAIRGVRVYEEFTEGAKEGWTTVIRIMPYLVAMLVALGVFRASGALEILQLMLHPALQAVHFPVELLPMALMRPLSGSGSSGILGELLANDGISEQIKMTAATMFGSTETTFYVLAVYFGSVGIRRTRHALAAGLCADAAGVIAAIAICHYVFGA